MARRKQVDTSVADTEQHQYLVSIGQHHFDPTETRALRARRDEDRPDSAPDPNDTRIVQFQRTLTGPDIERIRAEYGLALTAYVPNLAYVERVDAATRRRLGRDPLVRAVAAYRPEYKFDEPVVTQLEEEPGRVPIVASLFDGGSIPLVVAALEQAGAVEVQPTDSRHLGGLARVVFTAPVREVADLASRLPDVRWLELEPRLKEDDVNASRFIQGGTNTTAPVWDRGLHGEGQIIGMLEGNTPDIRHCFFADAAPNTPGPGHRKVVSLRNASIGAHATFVAGCAVGDERGNSGANANRGSAWAARLAAGSAGNATLLIELTNNMNAGAFVHTNSWHDNRHGAGIPAPYNQVAIDTDTFLRNNEEHVVLGSAGNTGEEQGPPGTAKNALCVAAADANGTRIDDGNPGPTADNRRKPDIVAVGCTIRSSTGSACVSGPFRADDPCATSWATPHAAGAAALVRQYFTEGWWATGSADAANAITPSGALIRAVLVASAVDMSGAAGYPSNTEGWGILRLDRALMFSDNGRNLVVRDIRNTFGLRTGEDFTQRYTVNQAGQQLRVVLAYTDAPGTTGAANTTVNDLDLRVADPAGVRYVGNDFDAATGRSRPGSTSTGDAINTIEVVLVDNAVQGVWEITVHATAVTVDRQGFGLSITATEPPPTSSSDCFVATAVYADPRHPDVVALRDWRDRALTRPGLAGAAMRAFSALYWKVGPPAARVVRRLPRLSSFLRRRVLPPLVTRLTRTRPEHHLHDSPAPHTPHDETGEDQPCP